MTRGTEVVALIREFVAQHSGREGQLEEWGDDHDLFESGDLDSFGFVELLGFLADRTGTELDLSDLDPSELARVRNLVKHFENGNSA